MYILNAREIYIVIPAIVAITLFDDPLPHSDPTYGGRREGLSEAWHFEIRQNFVASGKIIVITVIVKAAIHSWPFNSIPSR